MRIIAIENPSIKRKPVAALTNEGKVALAIGAGIIAGSTLIGWSVAKWKGVAIGGALGIASMFFIPAPSRW